MAEKHSPERDVAELQERTERLEQDIEKARSDWDRKRHDPSVPGARPPDADAEDPS